MKGLIIIMAFVLVVVIINYYRNNLKEANKLENCIVNDLNEFSLCVSGYISDLNHLSSLKLLQPIDLAGNISLLPISSQLTSTPRDMAYLSGLTSL